jgi:archaellum component FlaC
MFPSSSTETKIALLEERINVYEQMMQRIDNAIQKIGETSQNISKMLAVHNERLEQCNRTDNVIITMIEDIKTSSKQQHDEISKEMGERLDKVEKKVEHVSQIKWMVIGMGAIAAVIVTAVSQLAGGMFNPTKPADVPQIQQERLAK